ncbi:uncharacterized protein LOC116587090 isoform X1 [Mustela erminea]|uniref:uncharacterized protein LOC116587090 isoform X1 n=1 Tax=Mustela erminea TaxID=36723 RepID=UPI001386AB97|nr:uncharacterized protein LOC116587090 isoform X1 [Mustela erminea]XP_032193689.1 uncharacterized protein LOC116587090 isoform X1 [Mustela erminea]XP_032193690.1 uncharacterized protein LOC116587090 isoform X1 [Mustela erminea]XP_032193691.1 uncharacterized protein LOC116587090 isoform X1 [Mustela erminea]
MSGTPLPAFSWCAGRLGGDSITVGAGGPVRGPGLRAAGPEPDAGAPGHRWAASDSVDFPTCSGSLALSMAWPGVGVSWLLRVCAGPGGTTPSLWGASQRREKRKEAWALGTLLQAQGHWELFGAHCKEADWVSISSRRLSPAGWARRVYSWLPACPPWPAPTTTLQATDAQPLQGAGRCPALAWGPRGWSQEYRGTEMTRKALGRCPLCAAQEGESGGVGALSLPGGGAGHTSSFRAKPRRPDGVLTLHPPGPGAGLACPAGSPEDLSEAASGGVLGNVCESKPAGPHPAAPVCLPGAAAEVQLCPGARQAEPGQGEASCPLLLCRESCPSHLPGLRPSTKA